MRSPKTLITAFALLAVSAIGLRAEAPAAEPAAPATKLSMPPAVGPRSLVPPQSSLTPEENAILGRAHAELQKDPELQELNLQIKTLIEKRTQLAEEKLEKISPEAVAILQKMKANHEKAQTERRAQMEALQAKRKAAQEKEPSETPSNKAESAPTLHPAPSVPAVTP